MKLTHLFCQQGRLCSQYKLISIYCCLISTLIFGIGMLRTQIVSEPQELWVNKQMRTKKEQDLFNQRYGEFFRINQIILKKKAKQIDMINTHDLLSLYDLQQQIETKNFLYNNKTYQLDDFCYKPISTQGCLATSALDYWKKNKTRIQQDQNYKKTLQCVAEEGGDKLPCSDKNGIPVIQQVVFGGIQCQEDKDGILCGQCIPSAKALMTTYLLNNDQFTQSAAKEWEKQVYIQTIKEYNDYYKQNNIDLEISYLSERSIPDELVTETNQNVLIVVISYLVMFCYIVINLGNLTLFGILLGIFAILIVLMSLVSAIGLAGYFNIGLSMISAEVVPFLVLAIGVDNMFLIGQQYLRIKRNTIFLKNEDFQLTIDRLMGQVMAEVGPSILTACVSEFCAFIVGYFTNIPALSQFSFIAAFSVLFNFLYIISGFVAFFAWNQKVQYSNKKGSFNIQNDKDEIEGYSLQKQRLKSVDENSIVSELDQNQGLFYMKSREKTIGQKIIQKGVISLVTNQICQFIVIFMFLGLVALSIIACIKLDLGLEQQVSLIDDSDVYNYFTNQFKYGEAGPPAYIVMENMNYTNDYQLEQIKNLQDSLSSLKESVQPPIYDWTQVFQQFMNEDGTWVDDCDVRNTKLLPYNLQLKKFKSIKIDSKCCQSYGICGEQFEKDIIFDNDGNVQSTRLRYQHIPLINSEQFIKAFYQARQVTDHYNSLVNKYVDEYNANTTSQKLDRPIMMNVNMFSYSLFYIYFEQYSYIRGLALQNLLITTGVVYLVILLVKNFRSAVLTFSIVFATSFNVIGICYLFNLMNPGFPIQINAVSVVNLIIAIGLSVEFSIHIVINFINQQGETKERTCNALETIGASIFSGIICTKFLGVLVLAFANSTLFKLYYFQMYMAIILMGTFHGLYLLPVILIWFGPRSSRRRSSSHQGIINSLLSSEKIIK